MDPTKLNSIYKLREEIEKNDLKIMELKDDFNSGKMELNQYTSTVEEIEKNNEEISKKVSDIEKNLSENERILKKEIDSVIANFQADFDPDNVAHIRVDFYSSTGAYYLVQIKIHAYPNRIEVIFPPELEDLIGPASSIPIIKSFPQDPPARIVEILRTIEEEIQGKSRLDEEIQMLYQEFDVEQPTEVSSKLKIYIYSLDAEQFDLEVDIKDFPQLPTIILSPKLEKYIFLDSLKSMKSWHSSSHVAEILHEISAILDRKLRINLELKLFKEKNMDAVFDSLNNVIHVTIMESKTSPNKYKFEIKIPENYPSAPPSINLLSFIKDQQKTEEFQNAINNFIVEWFPAANLAEFFQELKDQLAETSQFVCGTCKKLACPTCSKNVTGTVPGVVGEHECSITCPHCKRLFHACCWKEHVKFSQKCPICQHHISIW